MTDRAEAEVEEFSVRYVLQACQSDEVDRSRIGQWRAILRGVIEGLVDQNGFERAALDFTQ